MLFFFYKNTEQVQFGGKGVVRVKVRLELDRYDRKTKKKTTNKAINSTSCAYVIPKEDLGGQKISENTIPEVSLWCRAYHRLHLCNRGYPLAWPWHAKEKEEEERKCVCVMCVRNRRTHFWTELHQISCMLGL